MSLVRRAGQWVKRERLAWRLRGARGEDVKRENAGLNWREFWQKRTRLKSFPRIIQVGTNWTCNLRCDFCRLTLESTQAQVRALPKSEREISPAVLDAVLELMPYPESLTLTPLGEPLLYSGLGRILERHRELGCRNLALTTNANLIDDDRARMLVEGGLSHLYVSCDSSDPAIYAQMRVLGSLDKVEAALEAVNRWKDRLKSPLPSMTLASTFMERNVRQMPDLLEFAVRHRFNSYSVQLMEVENPVLAPEFLGNHVGIAKQMVLETLRRAEGQPIDVRIHLALRNLLTSSLSLPEAGLLEAAGEGGTLDSLSTRGRHLTEKCHYPWYFLMVDTDGDCRPCCWASVSLGNLNSSSFGDVWNGPVAVRMRESFLANRIPRSCQRKHCRVDLDHTGELE